MSTAVTINAKIVDHELKKVRDAGPLRSHGGRMNERQRVAAIIAAVVLLIACGVMAVLAIPA